MFITSILAPFVSFQISYNNMDFFVKLNCCLPTMLPFKVSEGKGSIDGVLSLFSHSL